MHNQRCSLRVPAARAAEHYPKVSVLNPRLNKFVSRFDRLKVDGFLVTNTANIRYLTRYNAEAAWLLVFPKQAYYLTDGRFTLEAKKGLNGVPVVESTQPFLDPIERLLRRHRAKTIGFDAKHISLATFQKVKNGLPKGTRLVACNGVVETLRQVKEKEEIAQIRKALKINLAMMHFVAKILRPGLTEQQVKYRLDDFVRAQRAGHSFDPIVASGPNSAYPHACTTDRRLRKGEPVMVDAGIDLNGYKSDLTRMFFLGKMTTYFRKVHEAVAAAQQQAIRKIHPQIPASVVDQEARNYLQEKGLARFFSHSLGHGVGLEVHEEPRISAKSKARLEPGMVFTVEPGVYLAGKFGVRIEDMVLVTEDGCEVLS